MKNFKGKWIFNSTPGIAYVAKIKKAEEYHADKSGSFLLVYSVEEIIHIVKETLEIKSMKYFKPKTPFSVEKNNLRKSEPLARKSLIKELLS